MLKYVKDIQEDGKCLQIGEGSNSKFYESIGMVQKDVEQSEVDGNWYLTEKCPHYTEEEIAEKKELSQLTQEAQELEATLKELQSMFTQAQMIGDTETMEEISNTTKELLGLVEEPTEEETNNGTEE